MRRLLVALALGVALLATVVAGQQCHTFQSLNAPAAAPELTRCGSGLYQKSACCTTASAKRAYNWVYEDDGCGVVGYVCAVAMSELACAVNCATDLVVTGFNYNASRPVLPGKVVIGSSAAKKLYSACEGYSWCGTQQQFTSSCSFLSVSVKSKSKYGRTASLSISTNKDTCSLVADLDPVSFCENVLGLVVHQDDSVGFISTITSVPYYPGNSADQRAPISVALITLLALAGTLLALGSW